jgi:hypothetical protein
MSREDREHRPLRIIHGELAWRLHEPCRIPLTERASWAAFASFNDGHGAWHHIRLEFLGTATGKQIAHAAAVRAAVWAPRVEGHVRVGQTAELIARVSPDARPRPPRAAPTKEDHAQ